MVKANGTVAKDIAIYFLDMTQERYTPAIVSRTVGQAKNLLESGYTQTEICSVIDFIVNETSTVMYSLGYVSSAINDVLKDINAMAIMKAHKELIEESKASYQKEENKEVDKDVESQIRNRDKLSGFGNEPGKREKSYLDMLKE